MTYYTGFIGAVPTANKQKYIDHVRAAWPLFRNHGAIRMVESWGVDVPRGKVNDLYGAVLARDDETVVYSWIEWPDKATADTARQGMESDPLWKDIPEMPFDGSRMIYGGFEPVLAEGTDRGAGYFQGFALAVPGKNKEPYVRMAGEAWESAFRPHGCLGIVEAWGIDVPHGKQTDFYRASKAEPDEVPIFSWAAWPDKATADAAAKAMEAGMEGQDFPETPFDGMRMMWGGFEPIFVSDGAR
ncbi:DUF1428 domain-containing protein [Paenirhodobacter populi]|uniref:DUF1428 domain-containing protein n=1 Tax=Paenirhodobacter populi TaxID=2306993 RepID=A0A443JB12_9RHOB|nr:DUF1428 family protein [Sinirhodobacter populi]RWR17682.1 DUF1428 domain-containing protein [Sinirhodobacter populi]